MGREWVNWSGSLRFTPGRLLCPGSEGELAAIVAETAARAGQVRIVGAGHSSSPLVHTEDTLVSLERFQDITDVDPASGRATIAPGVTIKEAGAALLRHGLSLHNTGDVDVQTLAGAISTGTHGTGLRLGNLSTMLVGVRLVDGRGQIHERTIEDHPDFLRAARVSLGTLGIVTRMRVQLIPAQRLLRREWCVEVDDLLENLDDLTHSHRNFDFYWYPRSDEVKLRTHNPTDLASPDMPCARCLEEKEGFLSEIMPKSRHLRFDEMEYALPLEAGRDCFLQVRERVRREFRREVAWRILCRTVAADDSWLSPAFGRATFTISLHHNAGLPFWDYFRAIEPIFLAHGGRPHWGKKHSLRVADLRALYPMWDRFQEVRREMDPRGLFMPPPMRALLQQDPG